MYRREIEYVPMAKVGERFVANVTAEGMHLRLFSEFTEAGVKALVWDIEGKQEILHEMADDLAEGKEKCQQCVNGLLSKPQQVEWLHQD
jgi:hypothetical protein